MVANEGAGRIRMHNGARMSLRSFRESMAEQYPEPTLVADVRKLRKDVDHLSGPVEANQALQRAQADMASGRLYNDAPADIKAHAAEVDLWK